MWIFCCGMMRSGSTLQYQIVSQLVEDAGIGQRITWHNPNDFPQLQEQYADTQEWKVLKSHAFTPAMGAEFNRGAKGVYIYRDIRDVLVSMSRKQKVSAGKIINGDFIQEQLSNYEQWTQQPRVLVSRYEDVIADLATEVRRIANHLEITVDDSYCQQLAQDYDLDKQKERIEDAKRIGDLDVRGRMTIDKHSLLHTDHIQDGRVDVWKQSLSGHHIGKLEAIAGDWLKAHGYELNKASAFWRFLYKIRK